MREAVLTTRSGRNLAISVILALLLALGVVGQVSPASAATATTIKVMSIVPSSGSKVVAGEVATVAGKASTNLAGKTLKLQVFKAGKWVDLGISVQGKSSGNFFIKFTPNTTGSIQYRVLFAGSTSLKASSGSKSVTVWKWYSLAGQQIVAADSNSCCSSATPKFGTSGYRLIGKYYSSALIIGSANPAGRTGWAEYNLSYKCSAFRTTVGLEDSSASGSTVQFSTKLDGSNVAGGSVSANLGQAKKIEISTAGSFRVRLEYSIVSGSAKPMWAYPSILCTGSPNSK